MDLLSGRKKPQDTALGHKREMGRLRVPWREAGKLGEFRPLRSCQEVGVPAG